MTDTDLTARSTRLDHVSTAELVKQASEQMTRLVRDEIRLAKAELRDKGRRVGTGIGLFSAAGMIVMYAVGVLLAAGILALSLVLAAWLSALLVGVAMLLVAGVMMLIGRAQLRRATPPYPQEAMQSMQTDAQLLKSKAGR